MCSRCIKSTSRIASYWFITVIFKVIQIEQGNYNYCNLHVDFLIGVIQQHFWPFYCLGVIEYYCLCNEKYPVLLTQLFVLHLSIIHLFVIAINIIYLPVSLWSYLFVCYWLFASHSSHWCVIFSILFFYTCDFSSLHGCFSVMFWPLV